MKWSMQSCLLFLTALPCLIWAFKLGELKFIYKSDVITAKTMSSLIVGCTYTTCCPNNFRQIMCGSCGMKVLKKLLQIILNWQSPNQSVKLCSNTINKALCVPFSQQFVLFSYSKFFNFEGFIVGENDCCIRNMIEYSLNKSTGLNNGAKKLNYKPVMINVTKLDNAYKVGQKGKETHY